MLENYMKKIESLISPNNYSRSNFKDKITTENQDDNLIYTIKAEVNGFIEEEEEENIEEQPNQEEKEKLMKKRIETEGKLESPEEIKINSSKSVQSATINTKKSSKSHNSEGDVKSLLEKIHNLNLKNMTYRNDIEKFKHKINQLTQELESQKKLIAKYEQEKDTNAQYLLKLESLLQNRKSTNNNIENIIYSQAPKTVKTQTDLPISICNDVNDDRSEQNSVKGNKSIFTESNFFSVEVNKNNIIMIDDKKSKEQFTLCSPTDIREFIKKLYKENQKLKIFQKHVFEISKSYDDINDNLHESIIRIQEIVNSQEGNNRIENDLLGNYQKLVYNVNETLRTKQNEYNLLLAEKDEHISLIQDELLIISNEIEERKRDRTKEIQIIATLEDELRTLKEKLNELGYNPCNSKKEGLIFKIKQSPSLKIERRIEPAKNTLNSIVKHFETNLDMKDQSNAKMLGAISKAIR